MNELRSKIADIITNELFERFESPSSAVIGVQLADRIMAEIDRDKPNLTHRISTAEPD